MKPYFQNGSATVFQGDCIEVMRELPDESVHAVVTDPPYGLEFMGKEWDGADGFRRSLNEADAGRESVFGRTSRKAPEYNTGRGVRVAEERAAEMTVKGAGHSTSAGPYLAARVDSVRVAGVPFQDWCEVWAAEALRILKPGGFMLAFGGSRTWHRLAVAVEDAGFEIRDSIAWLYGSGFPKSMDVSKAIDKAAGAQREVVGYKESIGYPDGGVAVYKNRSPSTGSQVNTRGMPEITVPATDAAREWEGWGTALKPAFEPIVVGRKPLRGTVAQNVLAYGTGALNIDATRIGETGGTKAVDFGETVGAIYGGGKGKPKNAVATLDGTGRWPTNVLLDESQAAELERQSGVLTSGLMPPGTPKRGKPAGILGEFKPQESTSATYGDSGGASRFFPTFRYEAKAPSSERPNVGGVQHPTVKPLDLMRWLCRLVTPPGGTVLEPFAGSGTTLEAALIEGFTVIGIEREETYLPLIKQRLSKPLQQTLDLGVVS